MNGTPPGGTYPEWPSRQDRPPQQENRFLDPIADAALPADELPPARRLQALAKPGRLRLRWAAVCAVLSGALLIPQAAAIAWIVQRAFVERASVAQIGAALAALLAVGMARAGLGWAGRRQADDAVEAIALSLRRRIARRLLARGPLWLRRQRSGALSELAGTHVDALGGYYGGFWLARVETLCVPLLILAAVFSVDAIVGAVLLVTMPLIPIFMMLVGWGAEAASRRQLQALARMGGHFADRLRGLGLIRLYGRGAAELDGVRDAAEGLRERSLKVLRIAFLSSAVMEFFASLSVAMIAVYLGLTYLGMLELRGSVPTLGAGVFCLLLAPEFYAPLRRLAAHYHDRAAALAALEGIASMLSERGDSGGEASAPMADAQGETDPVPAPSRDAVPSFAGIGTRQDAADIRARAITLRPHGASRDVIAGLSLDLPAGTPLALAGPSGCGKSTLLEALAGWLPPRAGTLQLPPAQRIGYAPQRPHLFHGTLADNLRIARVDATDAQLRAAAEAAQVMAFAARLPHGLDTMIGERGFGLSGGEARRVALARLFLRAPDVLLLDEPTAFLDPRTEAALLEALRAFAQGRTLVVATHSAAVMRMAGRVLRLPEGRLEPAR